MKKMDWNRANRSHKKIWDQIRPEGAENKREMAKQQKLADRIAEQMLDDQIYGKRRSDYDILLDYEYERKLCGF